MRYMICEFVLFCTIFYHISAAERTFSIDYEQNTFLKDGQPFRYISCTMHYFQIPQQLWRDRMLRCRALGCNAIQTYVMWNKHQPEENLYDFSGDANFTEYLNIAQELGFVVVLRPGPYINAEMDFGGLPYWLLKNKNIVLRSSQDPRYTNAVQTWMTILLRDVINPMLYNNGGPIITVQIENEYGDYPICDQKYMIWLRDLFRQYLGNDTVLFTTDNILDNQTLSCGAVDGALATVDFGAKGSDYVDDRFTRLREYQTKGPLVNSEFYPGWLDKWGDDTHSTTSTSDVLDTMTAIWGWNVTSFSIYPAHGGTNWAYEAGSKIGPPFKGVTTSYDFDAPISEAGDTTSKFIDMRKMNEKFLQRQIQDPIPESPLKYAYGRVRMDCLGTILDLIHTLTPNDRVVNATYPMTMEELDQAYGFVLYQSTLPSSSGRIEMSNIRDRAYVIIDNQLITIIQRNTSYDDPTVITLSNTQKMNDLKLYILVENQGRLCSGQDIYDPKGLLNNVTFNDEVLTDWTMSPIDLNRIYQLPKSEINQFINENKAKNVQQNYIPSIYMGGFYSDPKPGDTFFDPSGWGKGQVYVNGQNMGRYWPQAGPQITLYVPGVYLSQDENDSYNQVYVLELDQPGRCEEDGCYLDFVNMPKFN